MFISRVAARNMPFVHEKHIYIVRVDTLLPASLHNGPQITFHNWQGHYPFGYLQARPRK